MAGVSINSATPGVARPRTARLVSYNIEMAEVCGGTFWKPYTPAQIAGVEAYPQLSLPPDGRFDMASILWGTSHLMERREPIDLGSPRLRSLARALGPSWLRVSGSWATSTYYDFEAITCGEPPKPYQSVLTYPQWEGVLDFARAVGARLLVSFAVIPGLGNDACRELGGRWPTCLRRNPYGFSILHADCDANGLVRVVTCMDSPSRVRITTLAHPFAS